jgi:hypothetical protein
MMCDSDSESGVEGGVAVSEQEEIWYGGAHMVGLRLWLWRSWSEWRSWSGRRGLSWRTAFVEVWLAKGLILFVAAAYRTGCMFCFHLVDKFLWIGKSLESRFM